MSANKKQKDGILCEVWGLKIALWFGMCYIEIIKLQDGKLLVSFAVWH